MFAEIFAGKERRVRSNGMAGKGARRLMSERAVQATKQDVNTGNPYMYTGTGKEDKEALAVYLTDRDPVFHLRPHPPIHPRTRIWGTEVEKAQQSGAKRLVRSHDQSVLLVVPVPGLVPGS